MSLEMIKRKSGLNMIYWQLNNTLEELQEKHPEKVQFIEKIEKAMSEISDSVEYFNHCDKMISAYSSKNYQMELEIMKHKQTISNLERRINELENEKM